MPLPPPIVRDLEAGYELGDATDRLFSVANSKQAGGALGLLSKGLSTRQHAYEEIFTYALVKFLDPHLYALK
jgi:non-canonical (house-cleaning) NTP pyrophosphatase